MASSDCGEGGRDEADRTMSQAQDQTDFTPLRLDTIPTDIRRYLLSFLDLEQLSALVHASPVYHAQYREDRNYLLTKSVEATAADAFTICQFQSQRTDFVQDVPGFLRSYSGAKARRYLSLQGKLGLDTVIGMAQFYFNVVKPLADYYASWALEHLAQETGHADAISPQGHKLTATERLRVTQAIYRFQLLCDIVTPRGLTSYSQKEANAQALLDILNPWQVEQTLAFFEFAKGRYAKLVEDVRWDLHPDNPKFDDQGRPPTPVGAVDLHDERKPGRTKYSMVARH